MTDPGPEEAGFWLADQEYDEAIPIEDLHEHPGNYNQGDTGALVEGMRHHGFYGAVIVQRSSGTIIAGNTRYRAAKLRGATTIPGFWLDVDDGQAEELLVWDNRSARLAWVDEARLIEILQRRAVSPRGLGPTGYDGDDLDHLVALVNGEFKGEGDGGGGPARTQPGSLAARFIVPPFSVLDARQGYWQARKQAWLSLGIRSEEGRPHNLLKMSETARRHGAPKPQPRPHQTNVSVPRTPLLGNPAYAKQPNSSTPRSDSGNDPQFYWKKQAAERLAGRELSTEEFLRDWYEGPDAYVGGTSIFDPVLCEIAYRWFSPPGGLVIDPFAGGSVRGVTAAILGRRYWGTDLSETQVASNEEQAAEFTARGLFASAASFSDPEDMTPVEQRGEFWVKRDDLFAVGGSAGGKVRTCLALAAGETAGLVTAGSRHSPQVNIVATVAAHLGLPCRVHVPAAQGPLTPELEAAQRAGAEVVQHRPGHNTVIKARARDDAAGRGWRLIPFGMEDEQAVYQTARQAANIPAGVSRVVVPVGSGMSLAGVLAGLDMAGLAHLPVLGVVVGADPTARLDAYAPGWRDRVTLVDSGLPYDTHAETAELEGLALDPVYEAKCVPFLQPGDLLWVVGCRETARASEPPRWDVGDARDWVLGLPAGQADLMFTCPPYYDLERYSDDPGDLSNAGTYDEFLTGYRDVIQGCAEALAPNRFAVIVVGEIRDKHGIQRGLVPDTIAAFQAAGMGLYNEAVLVTQVGSLAIRSARLFSGARKLGRGHQAVLVFIKGSPEKATEACGQVEIADPAEVMGDPASTPETGGAAPAAGVAQS